MKNDVTPPNSGKISKEPVKLEKKVTSTSMPRNNKDGNTDDYTCKKCGHLKPLNFEHDERKQKHSTKKSTLNKNSQPSKKHNVMIHDE